MWLEFGKRHNSSFAAAVPTSCESSFLFFGSALLHLIFIPRSVYVYLVTPVSGKRLYLCDRILFPHFYLPPVRKEFLFSPTTGERLNGNYQTVDPSVIIKALTDGYIVQ